MLAEDARTRLIGEIASLLRSETVPDDARAAALTLIGWLARRMPGEAASTAGVREMIERARVLRDRTLEVSLSSGADGSAPHPRGRLRLEVGGCRTEVRGASVVIERRAASRSR